MNIFNRTEYKNKIFSIQNNEDFNALALEVFKYQAQNVKVYKEFLSFLKTDLNAITNIDEIPFLPVEFFKTHIIAEDSTAYEKLFTSSGTGNQSFSKHYVKDLSMYEESFLKSFELFYGDISEYCIIGLLPSYLERQGSSLIYMCDELIKKSRNENSGYYLHEYGKLSSLLQMFNETKQKTLLIGVSFALIDFAETHPLILNDHITLMETGGMKGRRKEMIREELHSILCNAFGKKSIHSEYGMTELLSQAYSKGEGIFNCPPWMKILCRDVNDPLSKSVNGRAGRIHIVDLANINSCVFIASQDIGKVHENGSFEILGRMDGSEQRGCNLLIA